MSQHLDTRDPAQFRAPHGEPEFVPLYPSKQRRGSSSGAGSRTTLIVLLCLVVVAGAGLLVHASMAPLSGTGSMLASTAKAKAKAAPAPRRTTPPSKAVLATLNVRQNDLPGWTPDSSDDNTPDDPKFDALLAKCAPSVRAAFQRNDNPAEVDSPDFTLGAEDVSSTAQSVDSAKDLAADRVLLMSSSYLSCLQLLMGPVLADSLPAGSTVGGVRLATVPRYAGEPKSVLNVLRVTARVHSSGQNLTLYIDTVTIVGNLIESEVDINSAGAPMAAALEQRIITTVGKRVAAA